jgi:nucleotide-binding universal stress UspA family protein
VTLIAPFDGSDLAEAALVRATQFGIVFDEDVLAVSVVPEGNATYARERGWLAADERFEMERVVSNLHEQVTALCPSANFRHRVVDRFAPPGTIASAVRKLARAEDASMVFIGSENAGRFVAAMSSVGGTIATDDAYDVVIVRNRAPPKVDRLRDASPRLKSEFYLTD